MHCHYWTGRGHADSVNPLAVFTCCPKYSQFQNTNVSRIQQRLVWFLSASCYWIICGLFRAGGSSHYSGLTEDMASARYQVQPVPKGSWMRRPWPTEGCRAKNKVFSPAPVPHPTLSGAHSPGLKQHGFEADHSPPCSARVKNEWIYKVVQIWPGLICV